MAHVQQRSFCEQVRARFPAFFAERRVLDAGSLDINGNNRYLFSDCEYLGIDVGPGKNVDVVIPIHLFTDKKKFDTIISTECFEHDRYYRWSIGNLVELLLPGGLLLFTCASTGRSEHGTVNTDTYSSPHTSHIPGWDSYYKNLTQEDIEEAIPVGKIFKEYEFTYNPNPGDLYFWGVKNGP